MTLSDLAIFIGEIGVLLGVIIPVCSSVKKISNGTKCQLRSEMLRIYYHNREKGEIRQYEYENFVMLYEAYKALKGNSFIDKIYDEIKEMKASFDQKIADMEASLQRGNDRFKKQYKAMEVIINSVFALLEFEVHYCESEQKPISKNLEKAKDDLHAYLAKMNSAE